MIKETKGNLLEAKTKALVNAVNCVGVMGKGIALQFRREFSEDYFKDYKRTCQSGDWEVHEMKSTLAHARVSAFCRPKIIGAGKAGSKILKAVCRVWSKQSRKTKSNQWRCPRSAADLAVWITRRSSL